MNVLISGICGHMGREVVKLCENSYRGAALACGVDPNGCDEEIYPAFDAVPVGEYIDCIIDFSHHSATPELLKFAVARNIPCVLCTTGHTEEELSLIQKTATKIPVFFSANMSLGVALLVELAKKAAAAMPEAEIEIIEKHHDRKLDAPSGTALMLANAICEVRPECYANVGRSGHGKRTPEEIGIHAIRMGNVVGDHEVILCTPNQTITLKHEAHSRALFAEGAVVAAAYLVEQEAGLYDMQTMLGGKQPSEALV